MFWIDKQKKRRQAITEQASKALRSEGYIAIFASEINEAIKPHFADLWLLAQAIRKSRPELVLEYGSGYSTYVIAETLRQIGRGQMISIELDSEWLAISKARLPSPLQQIVEFRTPRPETRITKAALPGLDWPNVKSTKPRSVGLATIAFSELHDIRPDFVFLDGPGRGQVPGYMDTITGEPLPIIVGDPLVFAQTSKSVFAVDGRREQTAFLEANLLGYEHDINEVQRFSIFRPAS